MTSVSYNSHLMMAYYYITFYSKRGLVILEKQVLF